nr:class E sortase [Nocardioides sp. MAH-18]
MGLGAVIRVATRVVAEIFLTLGLLVVAFVVYLLIWSDVQSAHAQSRLRATFEAQVEQAHRVHAVGPGVTTVVAPAPDTGSAVGVMTIPRLGDDWSWVMVEGVADADLAKGPGHFPGTAMPGQPGNFAVAGHRATHGEPFAHLDGLRRGDEVVVETTTDTYTYVVDRSEIVSPDLVSVLDPVPGQPDARPKRALLTLVTCNPRWGSSERLIVTGHLRGRAILAEED